MKRWLSIGLLLLLILMVSGCTPSAKSEKEIAEDLQESNYFFRGVTITDYEIIKRQTNKDEKTDIVYIHVDAGNENLSCSISYQMVYALYNEGWILDEVYEYEPGIWEVVPLTGVSDTDIQTFINSYVERGRYDTMEIADRTLFLDTYTWMERIVFEAKKEYLYATETVLISQTWQFNGYGDYYYFSPIFETEETDRMLAIKSTIEEAYWENLDRYYDSASLYNDKFDISVAETWGENIDGAIRFRITKKDTWQAFWNGLNTIPQKTVDSFPYFNFVYMPESEEWGVNLRWLPVYELYDPGDDDYFGNNSYFIFDLDTPGKGRITTIYSNTVVEDVYLLNGTMLSAVEDIRIQAINEAKSADLKSFDLVNPIYGVWLVQIFNQSYIEQIGGYEEDIGFAIYYPDKTVEYIFIDHSYKLKYSYVQELGEMRIENGESSIVDEVQWWGSDTSRFFYCDNRYIRIPFG